MSASLRGYTAPCFESDDCPDIEPECFSREDSKCGVSNASLKRLYSYLMVFILIFPQGSTYSDRYDNASAAWVVLCAILMFFMVSRNTYVHCYATVVLHAYIEP